MTINKLKVTNFKSFKELEIDLGKFNILIGANASGKSNFIKIFDFLRNIANSGLDNAISMEGGIEYLRNINVGKSNDLSVNITSEFDVTIGTETPDGFYGMRVLKTIYNFGLEFSNRGFKYKIVNEKLEQKCDFIRLIKGGKGIKETEKIGTGEIILSRIDGKLNIEFNKPDEVPIKLADVFPPFLRAEKIAPDTLLLENPFFIIFPLSRVFRDIAIYDFDPRQPKKATPITGKAELEEDGSNLSIVLKNIIEKADKKRKLFNLVKDLLPFISDLNITRVADKSLLFNLREIYSRKHDLPASLISDGTINITAIIIALYFENKPLTIIEEPERNIHPYLISKIINIMKEASKTKQIIVTTHNPEIVKYAGIENLLLVSRDKDGFSTIVKPSEKEEVQLFLREEIGIDELFIKNFPGI